MGFWKSLGKIGLKIAPYAAMAIPGVGPLASAAIQGGISAAQAKAGGGSWKDALRSGLTSAGMSYAGGKIPGAGKGLSPSKGFRGGFAEGFTGQGVGTGFRGKLGSALGQTVREAASGGGRQRQPMDEYGLSGYDFMPGGQFGMSYDAGDGGIGPSPEMMQRRRRGQQPSMGQTAPRQYDFAGALMRGRQDALRNQPWRQASLNVSDAYPNPLDIYPQELNGY